MFGPISFEKLYDSKIVVHCQTQEAAKHFCREIAKEYPENSHWVGRTLWDRYKEDTCYWLEWPRNSLSYCDIGWFRRRGYTIIEFDELIEGVMELPAFECENDLKFLFGMESVHDRS